MSNEADDWIASTEAAWIFREVQPGEARLWLADALISAFHAGYKVGKRKMKTKIKVKLGLKKKEKE